MTPAELHRWARPIILNGLSDAEISVDVPTIYLAVHGVGWLETKYGIAWTNAGKGSKNWAADQAGKPPCPLATSFEYVDTHPNSDGTSTTYRICFRRYADDVQGCFGLIKEEFLRRPSVLAAARAGDLFGVSKALYETRYYEGHGKTPADRIWNHYKALFGSAKAAAQACGDPVPSLYVPTPEPWMNDLAAEHPTLRRGSRHTKHVKVWQRSVLNKDLQEVGLDELVVDGMFGPRTEASTKIWQMERKLKVDGIVGRLTWAKAEEEFDEAA
jgi:putative peptidoglycan binding protein